MKTVFQLIEENGLTLHGDIEHFAALVIANHPPQSYMTWQEGFAAGKQAEREACAKLCDEEAQRKEDEGTWLWEARRCAEAIRARSNT